MLKRSKHIILICGIAALVITVIFYQLTFDSIFSVPMVWISLMFLILTEIIGIIKALIIKKTIFGISEYSNKFWTYHYCSNSFDLFCKYLSTIDKNLYFIEYIICMHSLSYRCYHNIFC